jgi:hypothetical protein
MGSACEPPLLPEHAESSKLAAIALLAKSLVKRTLELLNSNAKVLNVYGSR